MKRTSQAMPRPNFADVVLPLPLDQAFTYAVPPSLQDRIAIGMRVVAPFQKRITTGYVVGLAETSEVTGVRAILDLPDPAPVFTPDMVSLCRWIADYYCCAWGEALQCAIPAGIQIRGKKRYTLLPDQLAPGRFTDRQRAVIAELHRRGPLTEGQLAAVVGRTALSNTLQSLERRGILLAESVLTESRVSERTDTWARLLEGAIPGADDLATLQRRAPKQAAVYLDLLNGEPERSAAALCAKHATTSEVFHALEVKGLIERFERESLRSPEFEADAKSRYKFDLNEEQQATYTAIVRALEKKEFQTFLLQGITGSGKTEVYLQAIEHALALGRDAIILVPEISLTPQTVGRFKARFQEQIAVLHSALTPGERYDEWRRAQRGEVRIVVGARSAIFAPLPRLGIIVVDEEHDTSYKQGEVPRYHARDVAIMRANMCGAVCVLGSATPSVESFYNSQTGKSSHLALARRATNSVLPEVELVDMRLETRELGANAILSRTLEAEVRARVDTKEQVILLLNRRGFSPFVLCPQCGWVANCDDCNVSLTYHAHGAFVSCHYCGARRSIPQVCGECHFNPLLYLGTGTQKVEDYLLRSFPESRIERMDADTTAGRGGHAKILTRFAAGEIDILVGTQMIAKGHDYPGVTLVGVINADTGLSIPDFRAAENTFQLLTQVAGRAGRGDRPGKVIVQTYRPKHFAIQAAAHHDYAAFYSREIVDRESAGYPPFRRMANLAIECEDPLMAERYAATLGRVVQRQIEALDFQGVQLLGPAPAVVRRVKKKYRWNLMTLSKSGKRLNTLLRASRDAFAKECTTTRVQLKIDLDPYGVF
ncbi:MAG: primosomal protein N' [Candidatus Hydrogenedentes bacterium]|nr:primosomal protein N' [Candidatus Hydrogenedentota bacterium]